VGCGEMEGVKCQIRNYVMIVVKLKYLWMEVIMVDSKVNHKNPVRIAGIPAKT
jgi:hypothetical protein